MADRTEREREDRGLSARHLILIFLAGVAVCGVFFSLGFLVGYNERSSRVTPTEERVQEPSAIPPTVNIPAEDAQTGSKWPAATTVASSPTPSSDSAAGTRAGGTQSSAASASTSGSTALEPATSERAASTRNSSGHSTSNGASSAASGGFTVQIAATSTKEDAQKLVSVLKSRGYSAFLVTPQHAQANDNLFRVQVGPFTTREGAERVRARLSKEGFKPFIRH